MKLVKTLSLTALAALSLTGAAYAQYPERPITLVVGWAPGGIVDAFARTLAPYLEAELGTSIVIENKGGASGAIGAATVADAAADGYTLLYAIAAHAIIPATSATLPYDVMEDFQYISLAHTAPVVLAVNPSLDVDTVEEFIELVKSEPGRYNYASAGTGSVSHVGMASLALSEELDVLHIPYQGSALSVQAAVSGEVDIVPASIAQALEYIQSGELVPLAVGGSNRDPQLPDVPTFSEVGISGVRGDAWLGLMGPAGMDQDVVDTLTEAMRNVLSNEELVSTLEQRAQQVVGLDPDAFRETVERDLEVSYALRDAGLLQ